ncbi:hypothetical protein OH492_14435 [Vibrio chagasii]|nr:hypothetical protein [Vibrio chagasii]
MNCGRVGITFLVSYIKTLKNHKDRILTRPSRIGMDQEFERHTASCWCVLVTPSWRTSKQWVVIRCQPSFQQKIRKMERVTAKVIEDKQERIAKRPRWHMGRTPCPVDLAMSIFDKHLDGNQMDFQSPEHTTSMPTPETMCEGSREPVCARISVLRCITSRLDPRLRPCTYLRTNIEDCHRGDLKRANIWQWIHHGISSMTAKILGIKHCSTLALPRVGNTIKTRSR